MLTSLAQQSSQYQLFHYAPLLHDALQEANSTTACLNWINNKNISFDWMMHLHVLTWLAKEGTLALTPELTEVCLRAAAIRWSLMGCEHINAKGILLSSLYLPARAIGLWKNQNPTHHHQVVKVVLAAPTRCTVKYAISYTTMNWQNASWFYLPEIK